MSVVVFFILIILWPNNALIGANTFDTNNRILPSCTRVVYKTAFEKYCEALIPEEYVLKYSITSVRANQPYAVYKMQGENNKYLVTLKQSPLLECQNFRVLGPVSFKCENGPYIFLLNGFMRCVKFNFLLIKDLVKHCNNEDIPNVEFVALHYSDISDGLRGSNSAARKTAFDGILFICCLLIFVSMTFSSTKF